MSRIAILSSGYPPDASGGSVNISAIYAGLTAQGNKVKVFTSNGAVYQNADPEKIYRIKYGFFTRKIKRGSEWIKKRTGNSRILFFCEYLESLLTSSIKKNIREFSPDILITVCHPFKNMIIGYQLKKKINNIKWYPYYLDPFFCDPQYHFSSIGYIQKKERKILKSTDRVIMLKWMSKEYTENSVIVSEKLKTVNLPLMFYESCQAPRSKGTINLVYTGQLYKEIRDPSAAFNCLAKVINDHDQPCMLYIVGSPNGYSDTEKNQWIADFKQKMEIVGVVPPEMINRYYDMADILISIGNSTAKLMPSKILQYIGTGKPIIHFYKIDDCPAKKILSKYKNALCISEKDLDYSAVTDFINKKHNAHPLSSEEILHEFEEYDLRTIIRAFL